MTKNIATPRWGEVAARQEQQETTRPVQKPRAAIVTNVAAITLIACCGLYIFRWVLSSNVTFYNDDWIWLSSATFSPWTAYLSIWAVLPAALFEDRPIEGMSIMLLHHFFGVDHAGYAVVILIIHIMNAALFYMLAARLLSSRFYGMIAGVLFVINHGVAYPAWWLATIADSASFFFCLCAFFSFASRRRYSGVVTALLYYLAFKSKEAALPFPVLLLTYSFLTHVTSVTWSDFAKSLRAALRSVWPTLAVFAVLLAFSIYYFALAVKGGIGRYGPYAPHFDLPTVIEGTGFYLSYIAFNLVSPNQALVGFLVVTAIAILTFDRVAILGSVGFFVATAIVLFLPGHRIPYYAYAGCAYIALMLVALLQRGDSWLAGKLGVASDIFAKAAILLAVIGLTQFTDGQVAEREWMLNITGENAKAQKTLTSVLPHIEEQTTIVVTGLRPGLNGIFTNGPCDAVKVIYEVWAIDCRLEGTDLDLAALYGRTTGPKVLLHYDQGEVSLLARSP